MGLKSRTSTSGRINPVVGRHDPSRGMRRQIADGAEAYYVADGNKNIIALKDSSGADVSTYSYPPFGVLENPADGDENPFRFSLKVIGLKMKVFANIVILLVWGMIL